MSVSQSSNYNDDEGGTSSASFSLHPRAYFNSPSRLFFALTDSRSPAEIYFLNVLHHPHQLRPTLPLIASTISPRGN